jgi:hypothetical protein
LIVAASAGLGKLVGLQRSRRQLRQAMAELRALSESKLGS